MRYRVRVTQEKVGKDYEAFMLEREMKGFWMRGSAEFCYFV